MILQNPDFTRRLMVVMRLLCWLLASKCSNAVTILVTPLILRIFNFSGL